MAKQKCSICGKFISDTATYCPFCTTKLKDEPIETEELEQDVSIPADTFVHPEENSKAATLTFPEAALKNIISIEESAFEEESLLEEEIVEEPEEEFEEEFEDDNFEKYLETPCEMLDEETDAIKEVEEEEYEKYEENEEEEDILEEDAEFQQFLHSEKKNISEKKADPTDSTIHKLKKSYDPDADGYYSAKKLIENIDAELDGIPKENILKTIGLFASMIAIIVFLIFTL